MRVSSTPNGWRTIAAALAAALAGLALALATGAEGAGVLAPPLIFLAVLALSTPLTAGVHELGHAAAAQLSGMRVTRVVVGEGRALVAFDLAGARFELRRGVSASGLTSARHPGVARRRRQAAMLLGGPGANLLAAALGLLALAPLARLAGGLGPALFAAAAAASVAQARVALRSLWPAQVRTDGGVQASDGLALLHLLSAPRRRA